MSQVTLDWLVVGNEIANEAAKSTIVRFSITEQDKI
jgi:hypothetical protein